MAVVAAKKFLRSMAQPFTPKDQEGISWWGLDKLEEHQVHMRHMSLPVDDTTTDITNMRDEYGMDDDDALSRLNF